jgi:hypothetical protein
LGEEQVSVSPKRDHRQQVSSEVGNGPLKLKEFLLLLPWRLDIEEGDRDGIIWKI